MKHDAPIQAISLVGYRGTGKSTVGRILAERWNAPLVDTDAQVVALAGKPIARIFSEDSESAFRDLESRVIADLSDGARRVVALGGGAVLREANRGHIRSWGPVVWLRATTETLLERLQADPETSAQRPALSPLDMSNEIEQLMRERWPLYSELATHPLDTDTMTPQQIAAWICHNVLQMPRP